MCGETVVNGIERNPLLGRGAGSSAGGLLAGGNGKLLCFFGAAAGLGGEFAAADLDKFEFFELVGGDGGSGGAAILVEGLGQFVSNLIGVLPFDVVALHHVGDFAVLEEGHGGA